MFNFLNIRFFLVLKYIKQQCIEEQTWHQLLKNARLKSLGKILFPQDLCKQKNSYKGGESFSML